jgi:hypothetical protein
MNHPRRAGVGGHWGIITAGDVQAEQARTLASAQATNQTVQACTTMDAASKSEWNTFYQDLTNWCNTPIVNVWTPWLPSNAVVVTGDTGDTMMAYEGQLQAWQQKIAGFCKSASPSLATFNPDASGATASQALRWGTVLVGFAATAYIIGTLARFIPSPPPAPPAPRR